MRKRHCFICLHAKLLMEISYFFGLTCIGVRSAPCWWTQLLGEGNPTILYLVALYFISHLSLLFSTRSGWNFFLCLMWNIVQVIIIWNNVKNKYEKYFTTCFTCAQTSPRITGRRIFIRLGWRTRTPVRMKICSPVVTTSQIIGPGFLVLKYQSWYVGI